MAKYGTDAAAQDLKRVLKFKDAILTAAAASRVRPAAVAGILSRETRGLPAYFIGDHGHGHGPMQIDDRSFPAICQEYRAGKKTNEEMISFGAQVLRQKAMFLRQNPRVPHTILEQAAIAAYNCGEGRVQRIILSGKNIDSATTGGNYSADILERAVFFADHGFGGT